MQSRLQPSAELLESGPEKGILKHEQYGSQRPTTPIHLTPLRSAGYGDRSTDFALELQSGYFYELLIGQGES